MAAAFAERECSKRDVEDRIEIRSGGTDPADSVHDEVVQVMSEVGLDISDRSPRHVDSLDEIETVANEETAETDASTGVVTAIRDALSF